MSLRVVHAARKATATVLATQTRLSALPALRASHTLRRATPYAQYYSNKRRFQAGQASGQIHLTAQLSCTLRFCNFHHTAFHHIRPGRNRSAPVPRTGHPEARGGRRPGGQSESVQSFHFTSTLMCTFPGVVPEKRGHQAQRELAIQSRCYPLPPQYECHHRAAYPFTEHFRQRNLTRPSRRGKNLSHSSRQARMPIPVSTHLKHRTCLCF